MDIRTLAKVLQEVNRHIPEQVREEIAKHLERGADVLGEFGDAFDEATQASQEKNLEDVWATYKDNVKPESNLVDNPTFEEVLKGWDFPVNLTAEPQATPGAESAGSDSPTVDSITKDIYRFVVDNVEDYAGWTQKYEDWNVESPMFITIDYLQYLSELTLSGRYDEK